MRCPVLIVSVAVASTLSASTRAADEPPETSISAHLKAAGAEVARESKSLGAAIKEDAVKVGAATKKAAHEVADASVKGAHTVARAAKDVAAKTKAAVTSESPDHAKKPAP
jgi:hypothetical protein